MKKKACYCIIFLAIFHLAGYAQVKDSLKSMLPVLKGNELRKKVRAAADAKIPFEKAESFVGAKAMFPGTDSTGFWINQNVSCRVTGGDLPKGDLSFDYPYLLRWNCGEKTTDGDANIVGIFWNKTGKAFYFEGWVYPPQ